MYSICFWRITTLKFYQIWWNGEGATKADFYEDYLPIQVSWLTVWFSKSFLEVKVNLIVKPFFVLFLGHCIQHLH